MTINEIDCNYNILKTKVVSVYDFRSNVPDVNVLKEMYKDIINSERRFSWIDDISKLIDILEKRDVLGPNNIEVLSTIYKFCGLSLVDLDHHNNLLSCKERDISSRSEQDRRKQLPLQSNIADRRRANDPPEPSAHAVPRPMFEGQSRLLPEKVIKMVCSRIGYQWKSLARYLKYVQECEIESIEEDRSITSNELRARRVMDEYLRNVHPPEVKIRLMKALRALERMDLYNEAEKIFLEYWDIYN